MGAAGSSKCRTSADAARRASRRRVPCTRTSRAAPRMQPRMRVRRRRQRQRRGERLEVALDVEEVDRARGAPHCSGSLVPNARPPMRIPAARQSSRANVRPTSKMRTRGILRFRLVCSVAIEPGQERRAHHVEMRCDRIQHARSAFASGSSARSSPEATKLKVITSCQSRATSRRMSVDRAALRFGRWQHRLHVRRAARPGSRRSRGCARPPRPGPPRSRYRSDRTAASR